MGCVTRSAFWCSSFGLGFLLVAFLIPLWLGRSVTRTSQVFYGSVNTQEKQYIGLFYRISCNTDLCDVEDQVLNSESVELASREEWAVNLVAVPVLVTICLVFSVLACCLLEAIRCGLMHGSHKIRRAIYLCAFMLLVSVIFGILGFFIALYMADMFYEDNPVSDAGEFPWAIMFLAIAMILLTAACILYFIIACKWYRYCHYYGCRTPWYYEMDEADSSKRGLYTVSGGRLCSSMRKESPPQSSTYGGIGQSSYGASGAYAGLGGSGKSGYGVPSFAFNGVSRNEGSTFYEPKRSSSYSDFRASGKSRKSNSADDLRYSSRGSLHDSPKILRSSRMPEFIRDESDFLSRKPNSSGLDVTRLSTRDRYDQPILRQSNSDMDILRATRNEPSVLDILYRDSRKPQY